MFLEKVERMYYYWNKDMIGTEFTAWNLALSPAHYEGEPCYYDRFTDDPLSHITQTHWEIWAAKIGLVVMFNTFVFGVWLCVKLLISRCGRNAVHQRKDVNK